MEIPKKRNQGHSCRCREGIMEIKFLGVFVTILPVPFIILGTVLESHFPKHVIASRIGLIGFWVVGYLISLIMFCVTKI
jgi:hypothetical protein